MGELSDKGAAGEGRETARRLEREQLIFLAFSRASRANFSWIRRPCARLDKTAMLRRLEYEEQLGLQYETKV